MAGQWRRQTRKQTAMTAGSNGPTVVANVFDAVQLVGTDPPIPAPNTLYKGLIPKAWCLFNGAGAVPATPIDDENVSSIGDNGTGDYTVSVERDFADTNFVWTYFGEASADPRCILAGERLNTRTVGSVRVIVGRGNLGTSALAPDDATKNMLMFFGRQA